MNSKFSTFLTLLLVGLLASACGPTAGTTTMTATDNTMAVQPTRVDISTPAPVSTTQDHNIVKSLTLVSEELLAHMDGSSVVTNLTLSFDVNHVAYVVQDGDQYTVVLDGKAGQSYEAVGAEFMPENLIEGTLAFFARREQGSFTCTFSNGWVWRLK